MDFPTDPHPAEHAPIPLTPESAEPCPTPLSTAEVFESFDREATAWEIAAPEGSITGQAIGHGPPLYFLNGLEGGSELFRLLAWLLREDFRCVLYDPLPRTISASANPQDPAAVPEVGELLAVAEHFDEGPATLYGTGFGGWVALAAMLTDPACFRAAVLQGAYANRRLKLLERGLLWAAKRSNRTLKDVPGWRKVFRQNHRHWFPPFDADRWLIFQYIAGRVPVRTIAERLAPLQRVQVTPRLPEIALPVLCLKTEGEGKLLDRRQHELEQSLPHCQVEWLQNSGLVPHWTHPHRVAKIIRQFAGLTAESPQPASSV